MAALGTKANVASRAPQERARSVSPGSRWLSLLTRKLSGDTSTDSPWRASGRAMPFDARPVSAAGALIRVSKAAAREVELVERRQPIPHPGPGVGAKLEHEVTTGLA